MEIVGKVNQDLSVKVLKATDMGTSLGESLRLGVAVRRDRRGGVKYRRC